MKIPGFSPDIQALALHAIERTLTLTPANVAELVKARQTIQTGSPSAHHRAILALTNALAGRDDVPQDLLESFETIRDARDAREGPPLAHIHLRTAPRLKSACVKAAQRQRQTLAAWIEEALVKALPEDLRDAP